MHFLKQESLESTVRTGLPPFVSSETEASGQAAAGSRHGDFVPALEGLRGLAALAVLLFHVFIIGHETFYQRTLASLQSADEVLLRLVFVLFNGHIAVSLFFVLSGYVLAMSLQRDARPAPAKSAAFVERRFMRIYPALFVNLVLTAACLWVLSAVREGLAAPSATELAMNLILAGFQVNGATWTLLIEFLAVPLMLLSHLLLRRYGLAGLAVLIVIAIAMCFSSGSISRLMQTDNEALKPLAYYTYVFVVDYQFMFLFGMLTAELQRRNAIVVSQRTALILLIASLVAMFGSRLLLGYAHRWSILVEGIGCAGVVGSLVLDRRSVAHRFLEWQPVMFLGRISYSFYLYHATAIYIAFALVPELLPPGIGRQSLAGTLILAAVCFALTVPMARASFIWVERPMMRLGRRSSRSRFASG